MTETATKPPSIETGLYRFFNAAGELLYVGIANNPKVRWSAHTGDKRWWPEVAEKAVDWFPSREAAEQAEIAAIAKESPRYNVTHSLSRKPGDARKEDTGRYGRLVRFRESASAWERFGQAAQAAGTNRSAVFLALMRWYMRVPGAKRPVRPPAGPWSSKPAA